MEKLNTDFYDELPGAVCVTLTKLKKEYGDMSWFPKAWEEYRQHIKSSKLDEQKMPGYVFNKYINEKNKKITGKKQGE